MKMYAIVELMEARYGCCEYNIRLMLIKHVIICLVLLASLAEAADVDIGKRRLDDLLARSHNSSSRIINFTRSDFE
jgi:hypothetical protein